MKISENSSRDRPREKLVKFGASSLSDQELLVAMIGRGTRGNDVWSLSRQVLSILDGAESSIYLKELLKLKGLGSAGAALLLSSLEFARRRIRPEGFSIKAPEDVVPLLSHIADRKQEYFIVVLLNGAHEVISTKVVSIGLVNSTQVHPREVFAPAIEQRATSVILAHNHPSGNLEPSPADKNVTKQLIESGKILGISVLDHIIFSRQGYLSFSEKGLL
jgi:DNA repair protein RadC